MKRYVVERRYCNYEDYNEWVEMGLDSYGTSLAKARRRALRLIRARCHFEFSEPAEYRVVKVSDG